jgi:hypothetical protein
MQSDVDRKEIIETVGYVKTCRTYEKSTLLWVLHNLKNKNQSTAQATIAYFENENSTLTYPDILYQQIWHIKNFLDDYGIDKSDFPEITQIEKDQAAYYERSAKISNTLTPEERGTFNPKTHNESYEFAIQLQSMIQLLLKKIKEKIDKNKKSEINSPERTIETMFRITSTNSQRLSTQADTKAHILISVNAIVISVLLSVVIRRMDEYTYFTIPVIILLIVNLVTIIFSILATRPNIPKGIFSENDLKQNKVNLLFFGNFFKMNFDDYCKSMLQVMGDRQFLYLNLLRNLHEQAVVLGRKYRMLKKAYNFFMFGLIIAVIAFLIASGYSSGKI